MIGTGTCAGKVGMDDIAGTVSLSQNGNAILQGGGTMFGRAECECRSRDLSVRVVLTDPLAQTAAGVGSSTWVGAVDCSMQTNRTNLNSLCEQQANQATPAQFMSIAAFDVPISAEALTNPKPIGKLDHQYACDLNGTQSRTLYLLVGDQNTPASCKLPVSVNTTLPAAPQSVKLSSGDRALTVRWEAPTQAAGIENYQILCRKKNNPNLPVKTDDYRGSTKFWFSSCVDGTLYRRPLPGTQLNTIVEKRPPNTPDPVPSTVPASTFPLLPLHICSDRIPAAGSTLEARIDELDNSVPYEIAVLAIDQYGNPMASQVVVGTPLPTTNPIDQFCDGDGCPTGFGCSFSPGLAAQPWTRTGLPLSVMVLSALLFRRRSRSLRRAG